MSPLVSIGAFYLREIKVRSYRIPQSRHIPGGFFLRAVAFVMKVLNSGHLSVASLITLVVGFISQGLPVLKPTFSLYPWKGVQAVVTAVMLLRFLKASSGRKSASIAALYWSQVGEYHLSGP